MKTNKKRRLSAFRPSLFPLEDRTYPGQTSGIIALAFPSWGLGFLDQALFTFPLNINPDSLYHFRAQQENSPDINYHPALRLNTPAEELISLTGMGTFPINSSAENINPQTNPENHPWDSLNGNLGANHQLEHGDSLVRDGLENPFPDPLGNEGAPSSGSRSPITGETKVPPSDEKVAGGNVDGNSFPAFPEPSPPGIGGPYQFNPRSMGQRDFSQTWLAGLNGFLNSPTTPSITAPPGLPAVQDGLTASGLPGDQQGGSTDPGPPPGNQRRWEQFQNKPSESSKPAKAPIAGAKRADKVATGQTHASK
ncbi:MAG TPA: hypothetical protein VGY77_00205 [Gemmataceae bacterium]|nr:hypothetical protein [Gemmataceae bacterium]